LGGTERSSEYIKEDIDLMIVIGSRLSDMSLVGISSKNYPKEVIHLDYDITFIGKSLQVLTLPIIGDIKANLQALLGRIKYKIKSDFNLLREEDEITNNDNNNSYISVSEAMKVIRQELPDDSIVFGDDGSHSFYAIKYFNIRKPGTFFFDDVFGAMGHAIGYSIGAQLAREKTRIICLTGDGCTFMHGMEIATAANYNIPVTFIILNNGRLDMPYRGMQQLFGSDAGTVYNIPLDAKKFGESVAVKSFKCHNQFELKEALEISNLHSEPIVIEVIVDPHEIPPTMKRG
jgi:acetolactate synthase-1/2/3 large subunit